jgi:hypothetical protein
MGNAMAAAMVVLHLTTYQQVPTRELAAAQHDVVEVYARIGVTVAWTEGAAAKAQADGARHLDVVLLTPEMATRVNANRAVFGQASHVTRRAYIFYGRAIAHARETGSNPARVLGVVMAHEVGHMLLPGDSHAPFGLMKASWEGAILSLPPLLPDQARIIKATLSAGE